MHLSEAAQYCRTLKCEAEQLEHGQQVARKLNIALQSIVIN